MEKEKEHLLLTVATCNKHLCHKIIYAVYRGPVPDSGNLGNARKFPVTVFFTGPADEKVPAVLYWIFKFYTGSLKWSGTKF